MIIFTKNTKFNLPKIIFTPLVIILFFSHVFSEPHIPAKLIDTPMNSFLDSAEFFYEALVYQNGGIVNYFDVGIMPYLNVGVSLDLYRFIGDEDAKTRDPKISARLEIFPGNLHFPAISVGYLGQGYGKLYKNEYQNSEKGFYVLAERELFLVDLIWDFGLNIKDFGGDSKLYGFINARYFLMQKILIMCEYDSIRTTPNSSLNLGFRFYISENFNIGIGVKGLNKLDDKDVKLERVLFVNYSSKF